jgi:multiple sugar transport system ATP-binding protein
MASVTLEQLTKIYPNGAVGAEGLDLEIADGEFLVLVGPSGCGKSTALRMVAGLEEITRGTLRIGERVVNALPPKDRDIAMVFQNYALYPHMTVAQNIGFALQLARRPKAEVRERVLQAARTLQLEEWLERKPAQLSGGQRQRVAMGRAIVRDPAVFLMDEPLSNLDAKLRVQRQLQTTTIYVTHDQVEAMTMGDRVAVLRTGQLLQVDAPERLYAEPANVFVAAFIGSPAMNMLDAGIEREGEGLVAVLAEQRLPIPAEALARHPGLERYAGRRVVLGIRPEHLFDPSLPGDPGPARLVGEVDLREALGATLDVHLRTRARPALTEDARQAAEGVVDVLERRAAADEAPIVATLDARSRVRPGERVELAVDMSRAHFFDPETSEAISRMAS